MTRRPKPHMNSRIPLPNRFFSPVAAMAALTALISAGSASAATTISTATFTNDGTTLSAETVTITGGEGGIVFTDTALFYFDMGTGTNSNIMTFDNIEISYTTAAVPEPSAALLDGLGALMLLCRRRI